MSLIWLSKLWFVILITHVFALLIVHVSLVPVSGCDQALSCCKRAAGYIYTSPSLPYAYALVGLFAVYTIPRGTLVVQYHGEYFLEGADNCPPNIGSRWHYSWNLKYLRQKQLQLLDAYKFCNVRVLLIARRANC
jgi:hypothetical protein